MSQSWISLQITTYCGEHIDDLVRIQERLIVPVREEDRTVIQAFVRRLSEQSSEFDVKEG